MSIIFSTSCESGLYSKARHLKRDKGLSQTVFDLRLLDIGPSYFLQSLKIGPLFQEYVNNCHAF